MTLVSGEYLITGQAAGLSRTRQLTSSSPGQYSITGISADLLCARILYAGPPSYQYWTKPDGTLILDTAGNPIPVSLRGITYQLDGSDIDLAKHLKVDADAGSFLLTGTDLILDLGKAIYGSEGVYIYQGTSAGAHKTFLISADMFKQYWRMSDGTIITMPDGTPIELNLSSYLVEGEPISFTQQVGVLAEVGSYTILGVDPSLLYARVFDSESGEYLLSGQDVTLTYDDFNTNFSAESGSYFHSASDNDFLYNKAVLATTGGYYTSGKTAILYKSLPTAFESGSYDLTGTASNLLFHRVFLISGDSYLISGSEVGLINTFILSVGNGVFALKGKVVSFSYGRNLATVSGFYTYTGSTTGLTYAYIAIGRLVLTLELCYPTISLELKTSNISLQVLN